VIKYLLISHVIKYLYRLFKQKPIACRFLF
jgi:hypothetical protein